MRYVSSGIAALSLLMLCTPIVSARGGAAGVIVAVANLQHAPTGIADLTLDTQAKTLTVKISLVGLAPNSTHPAHIHQGDCSSFSPETVKYMLQDVVAGANGQGVSTTVLQNIIDPIPSVGWDITVHNGPSLTPADQYTPIACGNITNPSNTTNAHAVLGTSLYANEAATGSAKLTVTNNVLTVVLNVSGLAPGSSHAAHIHAGNCENTQEILYDMSPVVADANGNAIKTVTFVGISSIPVAGWDINIHYSTDLSTQTGFNPILCGDITPN